MVLCFIEQGHVFNTKRKDVWDWFWSFFDKEGDFVKSKRNSSISMNNGQIIPYPIENYVYMLDPEICKKFILDLIDLIKYAGKGANNFEEFLLGRFARRYMNFIFNHIIIKYGEENYQMCLFHGWKENYQCQR